MKTDDEAFREAWTNYMEYDQTDWSGLTDEERYISVARSFWKSAKSHERATVREAAEIAKDCESLALSYLEITKELSYPGYKSEIEALAYRSNTFVAAHKQEKDND